MARLFDSTSDRVAIGTAAMPTAAGSLFFYVWPNWAQTDNANHVLYCCSNSGFTTMFMMQKYSDNALYCGWVTSGSGDFRVNVLSGAYTLNQNAWNRMLITWDDTANQTFLYLNGTQIGSFTSNLVTHSTTAVKTIGNTSAAAGLDTNFDGRLAEFAIWDRVVTADERALLNLGVTPLALPGNLPKNYYPLIGTMDDVVGGVTATDTSTSAADHPPIVRGATHFTARTGSAAQTSITGAETVAVADAQSEVGQSTTAQTVAVTEGQSNASTLATVNQAVAVTDAGAFATTETAAETVSTAENQALAGGSTSAEAIALTEGNAAAGASTQAQAVAVSDSAATAGSTTRNEAVSVSEAVSFAAASLNAENPAVSESQSAAASLSAVNEAVTVTDAESHATGTSSSDVNENQGVTVNESVSMAAAAAEDQPIAVADAGAFATSIAAGNEAVSVGEGFGFEAVWIGADETLVISDDVINLGLIDTAVAVTVFDDYQTVSQVNVFSNGYLRTATRAAYGLTTATADRLTTSTHLADGTVSTGTLNSITTRTDAVIITMRSTA